LAFGQRRADLVGELMSTSACAQVLDSLLYLVLDRLGLETHVRHDDEVKRKIGC